MPVRLRRVARLLILLPLSLALAWASAAQAADEVSLTEEERADLILFVNGNTLFTLYHELGHALVHHLAIPVLGREEDAVDSLAGWLMVPSEPDEAAENLLMAAADGHALSSYFGEDDDLAFWDEHSMDLQRFAAIYCLLYGSDPEGFAELAEDVEMPEGDRARCPVTYAQVQESWLTVLGPHLRDDGNAGGGGQVLVSFDDPGPDLDPALRDLVEGPGLVAEAAEQLAGQLILPVDIPVTFKACGETNAFFDPSTGGVEMCYELVAWFVDLYLRDLAEIQAESEE